MTDQRIPRATSVTPLLPQMAASNPEDPDAGPRVTLEDVLEAGTQNLRLSLDLAGSGELDFETLDEAVAATSSRLVQPGAEQGVDAQEGAADNEREGGAGLANNEIHCLVALLEAGTTPPNFVDKARGALERASIILHQAHQAIGFDTQRYGNSVDVILRSADTVDVEQFARDAITDLSARLPHHQFDAWMPAILITARRATPSLCDWLAELAVQGTDHAREALWPFVIDEFLINIKGRTAPLDPSVHVLTPIALELAIERLSQMPAIHRSVLAPGMFSLEQTFAHDLLARLMDGPARHVVGPVLLAAFRDAIPFDPGVSYCVFAVRQYDESIGWLLSEQMKNLEACVSDEVQRTAAWVLLSALEQLHGERRGEVWIPAALQWLGERDMALDPDVQFTATMNLMDRIVSERQGIRKVWSRDCRRAALAGLKQGGEQ